MLAIAADKRVDQISGGVLEGTHGYPGGNIG